MLDSHIWISVHPSSSPRKSSNSCLHYVNTWRALTDSSRSGSHLSYACYRLICMCIYPKGKLTVYVIGKIYIITFTFKNKFSHDGIFYQESLQNTTPPKKSGGDPPLASPPPPPLSHFVTSLWLFVSIWMVSHSAVCIWEPEVCTVCCKCCICVIFPVDPDGGERRIDWRPGQQHGGGAQRGILSAPVAAVTPHAVLLVRSSIVKLFRL